MPDGDVAVQLAQRGFIEGLADKAHLSLKVNPAAIRRCDSGAFLTTVLKCV
jgi:hypothetical protein